MKTILSLICVILTLHLSGQDHCRYGNPHSFDSYRVKIQTEHAGLFPDAYTVGRFYYQIEGNGFGLAFRNNYQEDIYGALFKIRAGIGQQTEVNVGYGYAYPSAIRPQYWQKGRIHIGIKQGFFSNFKSESWKGALSFNYIYPNVQVGPGKNAHGMNFNAHSSRSISKAVYTDVTFGISYFLKKGLQQSFSCRITMKQEYSKFGIFIAFMGDNYVESFANVGFVITDNYNYIMKIAIAFFDHASCPNLTYTHKLKYTKKSRKRYQQ